MTESRQPIPQKSLWITWLQLPLWEISTQLPLNSPLSVPPTQHLTHIKPYYPIKKCLYWSFTSLPGTWNSNARLLFLERRNLILFQVWRQEQDRILWLTLDCRKTPQLQDCCHSISESQRRNLTYAWKFSPLLANQKDHTLISEHLPEMAPELVSGNHRHSSEGRLSTSF